MLKMDVNLLKLLFIFMTLFIVLVGNLVNFLEDHLPSIIVKSFRYGKFSYVGNSKFKLIEVPKSWFRHFYVFSSIYSLLVLYITFNIYFFNVKVPTSIKAFLDFFGGASRSSTCDPFPVLLALTLMSLQSLRRFYETWFVSVFSKGKMNLSHYMVGFFHYFGATTVVLSEAKGFSTTFQGSPEFRFSQLLLWQLAGVAIFLFAWYNQFQCAIILANLRKNKNGKVVTSAHKIPCGGLFEYLSSPHLTCEVLLYLGLALILRQSSTFPFVFLWVLSNQMETAFLSHWWYKKTFPHYPKQRKAFIPFIM